jgi:hypothetical protein
MRIGDRGTVVKEQAKVLPSISTDLPGKSLMIITA